MMRLRDSLAIALLTAAAVSPTALQAHHSQAPFFDQSRDVTIEGVVERFDFRNPHAIMYVEVATEAGDTETWILQFASIAILLRAGITADVVAPGERIRATGHPAWNPAARGMASIELTTAAGERYVDPLRSGDFSARQ